MAKGLSPAAIIVAYLILGASAALAASPTLSLEPAEGPASSAFTATYTLPPGASGCPAGTIHFWWDAPGPSAGNPAGAQMLGSEQIQSSGCKATARLAVPDGSSCAQHNVYAFRPGRDGTPAEGTTATAGFAVKGCPASSPPPSPPPGGETPTPPPPGSTVAKATAKPPNSGATPPPEGGTPDLTQEELEKLNPAPTSSPGPVATDKPTIPTGNKPGGGPGAGGLIPYLVVALIPLGVWIVGGVVKSGPLVSSGFPKWGSLAIAVAIGVGFGSIGYAKAIKGTTKTLVFDYTGTPQAWKVPNGVTEATFSVFGAQGGTGCYYGGEDYEAVRGGLGGQTLATISVTPGEILQIWVGGRGGTVEVCGVDPFNPSSGGGSGGFNGGADGGDSNEYEYNAAGGGGASDIRRATLSVVDDSPPYGLGKRLIVAGGGGGGGNAGVISSCYHATGGAGGGADGEVGNQSILSEEGKPEEVPGFIGPGHFGEGGHLNSGGAGGGASISGVNGGNGSYGAGGDGALAMGYPVNEAKYAGGGGGGGWYGGGGGGSGHYCGGSGGGGSGRKPPGGLYFPGISYGHGQVVIQYTQYSSLLG